MFLAVTEVGFSLFLLIFEFLFCFTCLTTVLLYLGAGDSFTFTLDIATLIQTRSNLSKRFLKSFIVYATLSSIINTKVSIYPS